MMTEDIDGAGCAIWGALALGAIVTALLLIAGLVGVVKLVTNWVTP